jgi:hypothetical protein
MYFKGVYYSNFFAHAFSHAHANAHIFITNLSIDCSDSLFKNNLTLFHHQGLTLESILFPDSVLGIQLRDFHLHLFYIKQF